MQVTEAPSVVRHTNPIDSGTSGPLYTCLSLALFVHLFCVFVVLSANLFASPLQQKIIRTISPYVRLLNFDPNFTRYHLTHALEAEDDHYLEIEFDEPAQIIRLPDAVSGGSGWRGGFAYQRYKTLADVFAFYAAGDADESLAELSKAVGVHYLAQNDRDRLVVRCIHHRPKPWDDPVPAGDDPVSPFAPEFLSTAYEADVWIDADGDVQVHKRVASDEAAPMESE